MIAKPSENRGQNLSIMIPTFNCANYLRRALASVLEQAAGAVELAQIIVVDDCSTQDDPEAVVREMGGNRLGFHRHSRNQGPCANLNACLELAGREWIQILHGDDYMLPGAYEEFATCQEQFPDALAIFARSQLVAFDERPLLKSKRLGPEERGWLAYEPFMWRRNLIYPAGVLLHRSAIEVVGKFDCAFSHVNDWNYWWRLARTGRCAYTRACIAAYRVSGTSHGSSLVRSGQNVAEGMAQLERLLASLAAGLPSEKISAYKFYDGVFEVAFFQCTKFLGAHEPFMANWRWFRRMPKRFRWRKRRALAGLWREHILRLLQQRWRGGQRP